MTHTTGLPAGAADPSALDGAAAGLTRGVRVAAAATLVLGTGLQAAAWVVDPQSSYRGALASAAADAGARDLAELFLVTAIPFLVGGFLVYAVLGRRRSPRLAWSGAVLMTYGLINLGIHSGAELLQFQLAAGRLLTPAAIARLADHPSLPAAVVQFSFLGCILVGVPLTVVSLWRSGVVPRPAAALLGAFLVVDLAGRGIEAHLIAFVAASWIAVSVVRPRPARRRLLLPRRVDGGMTATSSRG